MAGVTADLGGMELKRRGGRVHRCSGRLLSCRDLGAETGIGSMCRVERGSGTTDEPPFDEQGSLLAEVVGFDEQGASLLPYEDVAGIGLGARVWVDRRAGTSDPTAPGSGRVLDALGHPLDDGPPLRARPEGLSDPGKPSHGASAAARRRAADLGRAGARPVHPLLRRSAHGDLRGLGRRASRRWRRCLRAAPMRTPSSSGSSASEDGRSTSS